MDSIVYGLEVAGSFIVVLGILVFVHEFGHFIVAKSLKIGVPVFSLGLGPRLFGFSRGGTDYRVSMIPLGGYVRLAGENPDEQTGAADEFLSRPRGQRFLVFVAGAVFNIVLAVVVTWLVFVVYGKRELRHPEAFPVIAAVAEGSPAEAAGLRLGDKVLSIDGNDARPEEAQRELLLSPGKTKRIAIERDGVRSEVELEIGSSRLHGLGDAGWYLVQEGVGPVEVIEVLADSPAERAGLLDGDRVLAVIGHGPVTSVELREILARNPGNELELEIERGGERLAATVVPGDENGKGVLGVRLGGGGYYVREIGAWQAVGESIRFNIEQSTVLFETLRRLFTGDIPVRAMSGPIEIARISRQMITRMETFLTLLAFISLQLGILNLLPIPVLDGGHILILGVEGLMRRELSDRLKERVMLAGLVFLLAVFSVVIFFDVDKLLAL